MRKSVSGFGTVVLLFGAAVVLVLAALAWRQSAEAAGEAILPARPGSSAPSGAAPDASADSATDSLPDRRELPGLNEMRGQTSQHADALQEALDSTN